MKKTNRLSQETSPYLLQHQFNPVDWYSWGDAAFEKAIQENKPIFLSIGYSTCHWCHVMEKESFEDDVVAKLLNETFVNIKVDREERPDIDHIYMTVCQMMTGQGGWPLNLMLTPQKEPFFAGTYIPKTTRHGHLGMIDLIPRVNELWLTQKDKILTTAKDLVQGLKRINGSTEKVELSGSHLHQGFDYHRERYDQQFGGFGHEPKFPSFHHLQFLFRYSMRFANDQANEMAVHTLKQIVSGGIYDHVGGGIHRYSVDSQWFVPHFEKMLYDQAMLIRAATEAYQISKDSIFKHTVERTVEYCFEKLASPEGVFFAGEDADSEGVEGKFYLWNKREFEDLLGRELQPISELFQMDDFGNFSENGERREGNILSFTPDVLSKIASPDSDLSPKWAKAREILKSHRSRRIAPSLDDKVLTDWNALLIGALAFAGRVFHRDDWIEAGAKASRFLLEKMMNDKFELRHSYCKGEIKHRGNIDDYAFLVEALLELYFADGHISWLQNSKKLADVSIRKFLSQDGGFYFSSEDSDDLIIRKKETYDGAYPSGNSSATLGLLKLARMTGEAKYEEVASKVLTSNSGNIHRMPGALTYLLCALDFYFGPTRELIFSSGSSLRREIREKLGEEFRPNDVFIYIDSENSTQLSQVVPFTVKLGAINNQDTLYVCEQFTCKSPIVGTEKILKNI